MMVMKTMKAGTLAIVLLAGAFGHYPPSLPRSESAWPPPKEKKKRRKGWQKGKKK